MLGRGLGTIRKSIHKAFEYAASFFRADNGTVTADNNTITVDQIEV